MRPPRPLVVAVTLAFAACGGGSDGSTAPPDNGAAVASLSLNITASQLGIGQTLQLTATPLSGTGTVLASAVSWSSNATNIASVSPSGLVTAAATGVATITATAGGRTANASITVSAAGGYPLAAEVTMPGLAFAPFLTTIAAGGTVTFRFPSVQHNVIFGSVGGRPADIQITSNANVTRTFTTRGLFPYDCTVHPGMNGQIEVK